MSTTEHAVSESAAEELALAEALAEIRALPERSKRRRRRAPDTVEDELRPALEPVLIEEQFDSDGDILWVISGRGPGLCSHSRRAVDAEARARLQPWELKEIERRHGNSAGFITVRAV